MLRLILQFALLQLISARTLILPKQSSSLTQAAELLFNESTLHSSPNSKPQTTRTQFQESTTTTTTATFKPPPQPTKWFTLNLSERIMNLDGIPKLMMLANNQLDFPIHVNKGDFVVVTVNNNMVSNASTSIHWHGLFQEETPWMDGPGMTTQCLIQGGDSLTYRFSTGSQSGTFWWHAHYASQYVDGLRGPFIIHDPGDTVKMGYDQEIIIRLGDHFHASALQVLKDYKFGLDPVPDSGIINGRGQCDCASIQTTGDVKCTTMEPTVFKVTKGTRYRLRFINMSAQAAFNVSIDGHLMTVIEQDGVPTNPTVVDSFWIASSQRYSVIVAANALTDNYWFRATMMDMYTPTGSKIINGLNLNVTAIWRYKGAPKSKPTSTQNTMKPLDSYSLGELNGLIESSLPIYKKFIYFQFTVTYDPKTNSTISPVSVISDETNFMGSVFKAPKRIPTLKTLVSGNLAALPATVNPIPVQNEWVFLQIRNTDNVEHVFHLHGHTFYVLGVGKLLPSDPGISNTTLSSTYPRRDAVVVPLCSGGRGGGGETGCVPGYVNILIQFTHPGAWLFHCHVEWHMATGLAVTFINMDDTSWRTNVPESWWNNCAA